MKENKLLSICCAFSIAVLSLWPFWSRLFKFHVPLDPPDISLGDRFIGRPFIKNYFHSEVLYNHIDMIAAIFIISILFVILYLTFIYEKKLVLFKTLNISFMLLLLFYFVNSIRLNYFPEIIRELTTVSYGTLISFYLLTGVTIIFCTYLIWQYSSFFYKTSKVILVFLFPVSLIYFFNGLTAIYVLWPQGEPLFTSSYEFAPIQRNVNTGKNRTLLLIFDALSYDHLYTHRSPGIELPEIDNLYKQAIVFTNAHYAAPGGTLPSITSLIVGRKVQQLKVDRGAKLLLKFDQSEDFVPYPVKQGLFAKLHNMGFNNAFAGENILPHCRDQFPEFIAWCYGAGHHEKIVSRSIFSQMPLIMDAILSFIPIMGRQFPIYFTEHARTRQSLTSLQESLSYIDNQAGLFDFAKNNPGNFVAERSMFYLATLANVVKAASNKDIDFIFGHLNAPHPPFIYDSRTDAFSNGIDLTYTDKLELVDRSIGILRNRLEALNLWEDMTIIITADHGWWDDPFYLERDDIDLTTTNNYKDDRGKLLDPRLIRRSNIVQTGTRNNVTLMIKLANQRNAEIYEGEFDTLHLHTLIPLILNGRISSAQDIVDFADNH